MPRQTLADVLARHAAERPSAVALRFEGRELSYSALARRSEAVAALLRHGWSVRPGDRVAWLGSNHVEQLVLLFALARIGAMLLPLNFRLAPAEWDTLVADCTPRHLVHDETASGAAQALAERQGLSAHPVADLLRAVAEPRSAEGSASVMPDHGVAAAPVLLVYTSGTTGQPRAAKHTQANLLANMAIASEAQQMTPGDVVLTVLPLFHVGGLCIQTLPALYAGATVLLHARFDAGRTLACIAQERPSLTLQVPATLKALSEHADWAVTDLRCLRAVWAGSSLLPASLIQRFHARGIPVCNVYGATETGPFSIALPPGSAFDHVGACGWPAAGVEVRLAGKATREGDSGGQGHDQGDAERMRQGESEGELLIRGPNVIQWYWPQQPACDEAGWFHTGDLAVQAADGSYSVVGRARDLIISGGENIHPAEIEQALAEHPAVAECAAFGLPDVQWGEAMAVAVVFKPGEVASDAELHEFLALRLARYKLPRRWLRLDTLPKTALGKVQRQALAESCRQQSPSFQALSAPVPCGADTEADAVSSLVASHTSSNTGTPRQAVTRKKLP